VKMSPFPKKRPLFGGVPYLEVSVKRCFTVYIYIYRREFIITVTEQSLLEE